MDAERSDGGDTQPWKLSKDSQLAIGRVLHLNALVSLVPGWTTGRVKLMVLSEDRLQIKWKEAEGPVQGYKVHVRALSGETPSACRGND